MRDRKAELDAKGLEVLGVSFDTVEENRAFAEKFALPFRLLCDVERSLGVAYGAADGPEARFAKRISYLVDEQGRILFAYPNVKPNEHLDRILAELP